MVRIIVALVIILAFAKTADADQTKYADALYQEAIDALANARDTPDTRVRLEKLREVHATLEQLIEQFPSSDLSARVQAGFGGGRELSLREVEEAIWQAGWSLCPRAFNRTCVLEFALTTADFAGAQTARDKALMGMIDAYIDAGDFQAARHAAKQLRHVTFWPSGGVRIAKAQAAAGDPKAGLATAMEMPHPDQRIRALAGVIEECTGTEDAETYRMAVDAALAASKQVDYLIFLPQALEQIAGAQAIAGKLADALTTAARIQEVDERSRANLGFTLAKVARLQADAGDIDGSKETIRKTLAVAARAAGERAGNGILLQTLDAQIAAKDIEGARATAERLGERFRVAASIMLYGWYASAHENESANAMLELALRHTGSVDAGDDRATILGRVGVALAKAGDVDAARTIFQEALDAAAGIVDSRQHAVVLSRLSDAVREARDPESTRKVAESLRALIEGDGGTRKNPILLASVAANLAQLGDVTTAMAVTAMIGDMEERVRALVEVAATLPN